MDLDFSQAVLLLEVLEIGVEHKLTEIKKTQLSLEGLLYRTRKEVKDNRSYTDEYRIKKMNKKIEYLEREVLEAKAIISLLDK